MEKHEAYNYLKKNYEKLKQCQQFPLDLTIEWQNSFKEEPGVYCIYENGSIIYVGETDNFRKRMGDLRRTVNHTFRRSLGKYLFSGHEKYEEATAKKRYHEEIEYLLNDYMVKNLRISCFTEYLGRLELEKFIIETIGIDNLYNSK